MRFTRTSLPFVLASAAIVQSAWAHQGTAHFSDPEACSRIVSSVDLANCQMAAEEGDTNALRALFEEYRSGGVVPKNGARADEYLHKAAQSGADWAILLLAKEQETSAPIEALARYTELARNNNCVAQMRVAQAYASGDLVAKNLTQAYFWLLLAQVDEWRRKADVVDQLDFFGGHSKQCGILRAVTLIQLQTLLETKLTPQLKQVAQDAASNWKIGAVEEILPAPVIALRSPPSREPHKVNGPSAQSKNAPEHDPRLVPDEHPSSDEPTPAETPLPSVQTSAIPSMFYRWTPLSQNIRPPQLPTTHSPEKLFAETNSSVWVVFAATSNSGSAPIHQGSAVAITHSQLLTNYHVIDGQRFVLLKQGDKVLEATIVAGDKESDRCVLAVKGEVLNPVQGLRNFTTLQVGERVYTIGSPSSLENTLGEGIVSGLRTDGRQHLIQTTAQISHGSSGGGLFDSAGNLLGITSFMLKDTQGLNFAVSAEDYFHP